jgi:predicted AlkP superfamily pyrophosphatase or phosphodiesterase
MNCGRKLKMDGLRTAAAAVAAALSLGTFAVAQTAPTSAATTQTTLHTEARSSVTENSRPKLVVLLVVDQMRGDYVDKFLGQWHGGLRRLVEEGAWFHDAAYPYAGTETCVGHATISTGAFPSTHGIVANAWWDRESGKVITCTADPRVKNVGYAGASVSGGDSAWRMELPSFAEELKFQSGGPTRVVSISLKARAAITMAGHQANAAVWLDARTGAWTTSSAYAMAPFVEEYAKAHPVKEDMGKTWALTLPRNDYLYDEKATGAAAPPGWELTFPHPLRGKGGSGETDPEFYEQWGSSPFADTYLTKLAEAGADALQLGRGKGTDFLAVSYSTVDYVGHEFGPRSWEMQDVLLRLDHDLGELFAHLDKTVGRGNYVVALSADHGVAPIPEDMERTGADAGVLHLPELQERMEKALSERNYPQPAIARITGSDVYFAPGIYERLKNDAGAMQAVITAGQAQAGVAAIYTTEEVQGRPGTHNPIQEAFADNYFAGRSGDLFISPKRYWLMDGTPAGKPRSYGTGHGTPYNYDQHVPLLLMGWGIRAGNYYRAVTPADIAPTFAQLCGITLASRDGKLLAEALQSSDTHGTNSNEHRPPKP